MSDEKSTYLSKLLPETDSIWHWQKLRKLGIIWGGGGGGGQA